jgi:hypothetical protein
MRAPLIKIESPEVMEERAADHARRHMQRRRERAATERTAADRVSAFVDEAPGARSSSSGRNEKARSRGASGLTFPQLRN